MASEKQKKEHKKKEKRQSAPKKIVIEVASPDASVDPVVASFPGGLPHSLTSQDEGPQFAYRKRKANSSKGRVLIGKDATNLYEAESSGRNSGLSKLCVGLYNKKTGNLTLHQAAEEGIVFSMEQSVRSYKESHLELPSQMTGADRRRALFESFGSSKKRKVLKSQAANVVNVESVVGSASAMMGAFLKDPNMSESNRKALEQQKSGTKVRLICCSFFVFLLMLLTPDYYNHYSWTQSSWHMQKPDLSSCRPLMPMPWSLIASTTFAILPATLRGDNSVVLQMHAMPRREVWYWH